MQMDTDMREVALTCDDADVEKKEHLKYMEEMSNMHDISQQKAVKKITLACFICIIFMIVEIVAAVLSNSLSLMTDASHLFCDICSFALNLFSIYISNLQGDVDMSFGYHRAEIIGALFSIFFIWALSAYILYSSIIRLFHVKIVNGYIMFVTAFVSTLANIFTAFILKVHSHGLDFDNPKCVQGHNHSHNHSYKHCSNAPHYHDVENHDTVSQENDIHPHNIFSRDRQLTPEIKSKLKDNNIYKKRRDVYMKLKEDVISYNSASMEKGDVKWDANKTGSSCEYVALDYYEDVGPNQIEVGTLNKSTRNCSECKGGKNRNRKIEEKQEREKEKKTEGTTEVEVKVEMNKKKENGAEKEKMEGKEKEGGKEKEEILFQKECTDERYQEKQQWREQRNEKNEKNNSNRYISTKNNMNNKEIKGKMAKIMHKGDNVQKNRNTNDSGTEHTNEPEAELEDLSKANSTVSSNKSSHACCKKKGFLNKTSHVDIYEHGNENFAFKGGNKRKVLKMSTLSFFKDEKNETFPIKDSDKSKGHSCVHNKKEKNHCCKENRSFDKSNSTEVDNINLKAAYIHALSDLIQNIGVIIASLIIWFNPQYSVIDPICSILFCFIVFSTTVSVIKEVLNVLMEGTPEGLNLIELKNDLLKISGVIDIHDLHVWSLSIGKPALACHIVTHKNDAHNVLKYATSLCQNKYKILHTTVQTDYPSNVSTCETYAHLKCSNLKLIA